MEAVSPKNTRTRHVCGQNTAGKIGISTSAIQEFDPVAMTVKTRSGKTYFLIGPPESSRLAEGAWRKWSIENGIVAELDVTSDFMKADPAPKVTFKRVGFRPESPLITDLP
jgi:hypothetical protein